ncbi:MAG: hypothetical protein U0V70_03410 [Terriglobia bacterium]
MKQIALTIDFETWHPVPAGKQIDWARDVFEPCEKLLDVCDEEQVRLTLMAEMGEYYWLCENQPDFARQMELQWINAIQRGHDVQLHLHPCWLPELGAAFRNGQWNWDWTKAKASDYPGDLTALISRCKKTLVSLLRQVNPEYEVTTYRAGAYQAQPFKRLHEALVGNRIFGDSSVYAGGISAERGYDYSFAVSAHQPYFASPYDPQLPAPLVERKLIELPIFTFKPGERGFIDNTEGNLFGERILRYLEARERRGNSLPAERQTSTAVPFDDYFVMIGHTKSQLEFSGIQKNLQKLKSDGRFQFVTLSGMFKSACRDLELAVSESSWHTTEVGTPTSTLQKHYDTLIPLDRTKLIRLIDRDDLKTTAIADVYPWMEEVSLPLPVAKVEKEENSLSRWAFPASEKFDCVIGEVCWSRIPDVDGFLAESYRVLENGGAFVSAFSLLRGNNGSPARLYTWQPVPAEIRMRLEHAGFCDIEVQPITRPARKKFPGTTSGDALPMGVRAWKRAPGSSSSWNRPLEAMNWVYQHLNPEQSSTGNDAVEIIKNGYAFCWGYAVVLGTLLQREGYSVKWLTMLAKNHPKGRGKERIDSHEVLVVERDGKSAILDAMANTYLPYSVEELLKDPNLARAKANPDLRYRERHYELYDTAEWYSRVYKYALRSDLNQRIWFWKRNGNLRLVS